MGLDELVTKVHALWTAVSDGLTAAWGVIQPVLDQIQTAWNAIVALFEPSIARLQESFGNMATGLGTLGPTFTGLQEAVMAAANALLPVVQALGYAIVGSLGLVSVVAINTLSAVFEALPGVIQAVVTQVTAMINLIATTVNGVVAIVSSLLSGDFAGAWEGVKTIIGGVEEYMQTTLGNMGAVVLLAFGLIRSVLVNTFVDLATAMGLDELVTKVHAFESTVMTIVSNVKAAVSGAWLTIEETVALTVEEFSWSNFITALTWPSSTAIFAWTDWLSKLTWPLATSIFAWTDWLSKLIWPNIEWSGWSAFVPDLEWPEIPDFPGWDWLTSLNPFGSAVGRSYWPGGVGVVGERGPEALVMPAGSKVLTNGQTNRRMVGEGGGMGPVTIQIDVGSMSSALDMEELAWRVEQRLKRAMSGR